MSLSTIPKPSPALFAPRPAPVLDPERPIRLTHYCIARAASKDVALADVLAVVRDPEVRYPSGQREGQTRYIGRGICVVVDDAERKAVTVYAHNVETAMREDQADKPHAVAHFAARRSA
jgi:hypothetical protein